MQKDRRGLGFVVLTAIGIGVFSRVFRARGEWLRSDRSAKHRRPVLNGHSVWTKREFRQNAGQPGNSDSQEVNGSADRPIEGT